MRYQLKLWNKKFGKDAKFVAYDTQEKTYGMFQVGRTNDIAWVKDDITKDSDYKGWDDFQNEPVANLVNVII